MFQQAAERKHGRHKVGVTGGTQKNKPLEMGSRRVRAMRTGIATESGENPKGGPGRGSDPDVAARGGVGTGG